MLKRDVRQSRVAHMEIQQMKYFLQICEDRNYSKAAANLFISQQALRKSIKKMEDEINLELFYRVGNQLALTPVGETMRSYCETIMGDYQKMEEGLAFYRDDPEHLVITVCMANGCYDRLAGSVIEPYKKSHPNVSVNLIEEPDLQCERDIMRGVADFGFCFGPNDPNIFDIYTVDSYGYYILVNKSNPLASRKYVQIADLKDRLIGIVDERFKIYFNFLEACHSLGFDPKIDFKGSDPYSIHQYSHITNNVTVTAGDYCEELARDDQVAVPIKIDSTVTENTFNIIVRKGISLNREAWKFIEYCKDTLISEDRQ